MEIIPNMYSEVNLFFRQEVQVVLGYIIATSFYKGDP